MSRPARAFALWLLLGLAAAAEPPAPPDIPDPFGLGERLALIDHLKERFAVTLPAGATWEQLVARYWQESGRGDAASSDADREQVLSRDRCRRLREELSASHGIEPPADTDEEGLATLLRVAREVKRSQEVERVLEAAQRHDQPASAEEAAAAARRDLDGHKARYASMDQELAADRHRLQTIEGRVERLAAEGKTQIAITERLMREAEEAVQAERTAREEHAAAKRSGRMTAAIEKARVATEREALDAVAAFKAESGKLQEMAGQAKILERERDKLRELIAAQIARRNETEQAMAAAQRAVPGGFSTSPPSAVAQSPLERRLRAAVVLVVVEGRGTGSGFLVTANGLLITNAHVVGDGKAAMHARWDQSAGRQPLALRTVSIDAETDLALLRAEGEGFATLELSEQHALARPLMAAGFPQAASLAKVLGTATTDLVVSRGFLTSVRRQGEAVRWLQHDCVIAPGSSGGPLIDLESGAVVGVNTLLVTQSGEGAVAGTAPLSIALPARLIREKFGAFF